MKPSQKIHADIAEFGYSHILIRTHSFDNMERELATLRAQRDDLLTALAELLDCHVPGASGSRTYQARERARIALGKDMS